MQVIVCASMMIWLGRGCRTCEELSFHSCQVCYENCEDGLVFEYCEYTYCEIRSDDECLTYASNNLTVPKCFEICCGMEEGEVKEFNLEDLQWCKEHNNRSLGLALGLGIPMILGAGIFLYCYGKKLREQNQASQREMAANIRSQMQLNAKYEREFNHPTDTQN